MSNGVQVRDAAGEPIWDWWTPTQPGDESTDYKLKWRAVSVMDNALRSPSLNGHLQDFAPEPRGPVGGTMNHFVNAAGNQASWRMQMITAEDLYNVTMRVEASSLLAPLTPLNGDGQSNARVFNGEVVDGGGRVYEGNLYNSPRASDGYGVEYNPDLGANEIIGSPWMPGTTAPAKTGPLIHWELTPNDDGSWNAFIPYFPAGSHSILQFDQRIVPGEVLEFRPFATATIEADRFRYPVTEVPQGSVREVIAPVDPESAGVPSGLEGTTFAAIPPSEDDPDAPHTPEWVTVAEDGSLTVEPGYDVPVGEYRVPVLINYPDDVDNPLPDGIVWATINVVGTPVYDDAFTTAGTEVIVNPNNEGALPPGSQFEVTGKPDVPEPERGDIVLDNDFETSINPDNGELTVKPGLDVAPGVYDFGVTATSPEGDVWTIPVRIHVSNDIVDVRIENGELIVEYANGDEENLGPVGDQVEITEGENEAGDSGYYITVTDSDGNEQTVFIREGLDGATPEIGENGNWWIDGEDTGVPAQGDSITITEQITDPETGNVTLVFSDGTTVIVSAGKDGESLTILGVEQTEEGTKVTFSNGQFVVIPRGEKGDKGDAGESVTVDGSVVDPETGETVVTFSDGSEVRIPAPQGISITGSGVDPETGETVVTFSDGSEIRIPAAKDGKDGKDGESLSIVSQERDDEGNLVVTFSNGQTITIPASAGLTVQEQEVTENGDLRLTLSDGTVITIPRGTDGTDGEDGDDAVVTDPSSGSSSGNQECVNAGLTVGIPLLALLPIGLITQMDIPATSPLLAQVNRDLARANAEIQKNLGIYNQNLAANLGPIGQVIGAVAGTALLAGVGALVANYLMRACSPDGEGFLPGSSDGSSSSSEGSSSSAS